MRDGDDTKRGLSPAVIVSLLVVVGIAAAAGTYVTQIVSDNAPVNVVVLKSDVTSFKEKPDAPAEDKDAGTKSTVMTMLDELQANKEDIEVLSLKPDAPEMPEVAVKSDDDGAGTEAKQEDANSTAEATPKPEEPKSEAIAQAEDQAEDQASQDAETAPEDEIKPIKRPIRPLVIENPVAKGPSMMVQLAAFRNQEKAEEVAALLTEKHRDRLQGLTLGIMQADTGASGVFWRVTTEPLPTEDARALCDSLKRAGQDCIFRKVAVQ